MATIYPQAEQLIASHGWMLQYVFPTQESEGPSFAYTIGLADQGLPELIVFALPQEIAHIAVSALINKLREVKNGGAPVLGKTDINFNFPVYVREVTAKDVADYAVQALRRSDGQAKFLQVCITDRHGLFPWEPGFSGDPKMYPVLGEGPNYN